MINISFKKVNPNATTPKKAHPTDAGFDLTSVEKVVIEPHQTKVVDTGIVVILDNVVNRNLHPDKLFEAQIRPRSGNAAKLGLTVLNTPGTIDQTYTGNIKVILHNTSQQTIELPIGSKIAQMVINVLPRVELLEVDEIPNTDRGSNGFGSTGI